MCKAINECYGNNYFVKPIEPFRPHFYDIMLKSSKGSGDFYSILNYTSILPSSQIKWQIEFQVTNLNWKRMYRLPFLLTVESKYKWFQYRINNRILATNSFLKKINIVDSDLCSFCKKETETIVHLFCNCENVVHLWDSVNECYSLNRIRLMC